jgi:hypothetical protein
MLSLSMSHLIMISSKNKVLNFQYTTLQGLVLKSLQRLDMSSFPHSLGVDLRKKWHMLKVC